MSALRIGTRGSLLAKWQAEFVRRQVFQATGIEGAIVIIKTSGDKFAQTSLSEIGGKGIFVKELEEALLDGARVPGVLVSPFARERVAHDCGSPSM